MSATNSFAYSQNRTVTYGMEEHALSKVPRTLSSVGMVILYPTNEFTGWFILVELEGHDFSYLMQFKRFVITF
jgi:hypothetical protein